MGLHDTGVALWRHVADTIERGIADGTYPPGARLPGETEIALSQGVHRHTVRRALATLAERGLVRAERGSGTYVETQRLAYPLRARTRFSEIVGAGGREPRGRLIESGTEAASPELAGRLGVKPGQALARLETLRLADRAPICVATTWLPADRFPEAALVYRRMGAMTAMLSHHGVTDYRRASTRITAGIVDAPDAALLDLAPGRPILVVDSTDADGDGRPVSTARARFAAERVEFVVEGAG
jgi:GntR family phosphonate transport system transcriptional regulator